MEYDILVHIGYHKTGTTFLQKEVFKNPALPFNLIERGLVHKEIIRKNLFFFDSDHTRSILTENFRPNCINVISDEGLLGSPHAGGYNSYDNFLKIKQLFPNAKILIGIREQNDIILSGYKQYIKTIGTLDLKRYLTRFKRPSFIAEFDLLLFCYDKIINTYMNTFGKANVLVLPYELMKVNPEAYFVRLFTFLNLDSEGINKVDFKKQLNTSHLNLTLETKRLYNILFTKTRENPHGLLSLPTRMNQPLFRVTTFLEKQLGKDFQKKLNARKAKRIHEVARGFYLESNRKTSELIDIDLKLYGYEL
ncbi:sulfotransferase [Ilyomonas limi]|uniref:Sulfotransferase n=1 Tax=Ilyomonas limi TaxID=2575867 RepID=A0A4U3L336_9BACT|nr:sulfotransferase domain-containing protein [Ilyomonas limi]TKK67986.1 sulfotransferase [Ilyomonas limi]